MKKYCTVCGTEMIRIPRPAEKIQIPDYIGYDIAYFPLGQRYNSETGYRQFGIINMCPKKRWWNFHDQEADVDSLHDSDLPELLRL